MIAAGLRIGAALVAALFVPAAAYAADGPQTIVRADPAQSAAAVALWYRAPAGGFGATPTPGLSRLAAASVAASTPITGTSLGRLIAGFGGRLSVAAYPDTVAITALVPPEHAAAVVRAMTADYFAPVLDDGGLRIGRGDTSEDLLLRSLQPADALEDALGAALFAGGPFHDGAIGVPGGLARIDLAAVRSFAERAFRPANAVLVLTGNVDPSAAAAVAVRDGALPGAEPPPLLVARPQPLTRPSTAVSGTGLGWAGPGIADETAATAMDFLSEALFAPKTGIVQRALGDGAATVTGKFVTYHDPGLFLVTIAGDESGAARAVVERAIAEARRPMDAATFAAAKAAFVYRLQSELESPAELADTLGWYAVEGNAGYAPAEFEPSGRYFRIAAGLSPKAVAGVAARYLGVAPAVVTLQKADPK